MNQAALTRLKRGLGKVLDAAAREHHLGHQDVYASRYALRSDYDIPIELMFEKGDGTPPYLWVLTEHVESLPAAAIPAKTYPKADLYKVHAKNGDMQYGRHSALEKMTRLGRGDLVRFELRSIEDLNQLLSVLLKVQGTERTEK